MSFRTWKKPILLKRGRHRAPRPKTFGSEALAKTYAEKNGIKEYTLKDLTPYSKDKKIQLIVK
jgi:hypothetical protein